LAAQFLPSLRPLLLSDRLRLTLVAGVRAEVAARFRRLLAEAGLAGQLGHAVEILAADGMAPYFRAFNRCLAETDLLWTKPSELTFFGALGLPLVFSAP